MIVRHTSIFVMFMSCFMAFRESTTCNTWLNQIKMNKSAKEKLKKNTEDIVPRLGINVARCNNVELMETYWNFRGTMDHETCHDGLLSLLPRQINEVNVPRSSRNVV